MANTFAQQVKQSNLDNAGIRHMMAIRAENVNHPALKEAFHAIPAVYRREPKYDPVKGAYTSPHTGVYVDSSQHSSVVTISIVLNDLTDFGCLCDEDGKPTTTAQMADDPKADKRLTRLLKVYLGEWEAEIPTHNTWSADNKGIRFTFFKDVPVTTKETHPSVRWLRKHDKVWDLNHHMGNPLRVRICINGYLQKENATCRIEVTEVREETVRTLVKRLVCADA